MEAKKHPPSQYQSNKDIQYYSAAHLPYNDSDIQVSYFIQIVINSLLAALSVSVAPFAVSSIVPLVVLSVDYHTKLSHLLNVHLRWRKIITTT